MHRAMGEVSVPYYAQSAGFSCGAACLLMGLASLDELSVSRSAEFDLWREATMIGLRGIDQWGLALPALRRGVPVTVVSEGEKTFPHLDPEAIEARRSEHAERYPEETLPSFSATDLELAEFAQEDNRQNAEQAGVDWLKRAPTADDLRSALDQGAIPILLVDLERLSGTWPGPHWVVVAGLDGDRFTVMDPDPDGPGRHVLSWEALWDVMDVSTYAAQPAAVVLGTWTPPEPA